MVVSVWDKNLFHFKLLRMIYTAVRDSNWNTATYKIINEKVEQHGASFSINYTALYALNDIQYEAKIQIEGNASNTITFSMQGTAISSFLRNRIGICVLHPLEECVGKVCEIKHDNEHAEQASFPVLISPHQPFKNIAGMQWNPQQNVAVKLSFEGDIFETEDQRNWGDASFKTYSTPAELPIPQQVLAGETMHQKVVLQVTVANDVSETTEQPVLIELKEEKLPFPKIGYSKTEDALSEQEISFLRQIPFDHLRYEIHFNSSWQTLLANAADEASLLNAKLELVIVFENIDEELALLATALEKINSVIFSVLLLHKNAKATTADVINKAYSILKSRLPDVFIGAGTNRFFTEWNREPLQHEHFDFVSFSINPQVHAVDIRTIIENLAAQHHAIATAAALNPAKPLHISPVTLKPRLNGKHQQDSRQFSALTAAYTLLTIRNFAQVQAITFYETKGKNGLINEQLSDTYNYLKKIKTFSPKYIISSTSNQPLKADALVLENEKGERLQFLINFNTATTSIIIDQKQIALSAASITVIDA